MSRIDVLKSLLRAGADRAQRELDRVGPLALVKRIVKEVRDQRVALPDRLLTSAVAHGRGVRDASVSARRGAIRIDVAYDDGSVSCALVPLSVHFAPQGAKEIIFRVEPPELSSDHRVRAATGSIATAIAEGVWAFAVGRETATGEAIVDREGDSCVRVDLRSVPSMRRLKGPAAVAVELLAIEGLEVDEGTLYARLRLPALGL